MFKVRRKTAMDVVEEKMLALKSEIAKLYTVLTDPEKRAKINESVTIDDLDKTNDEADLVRRILLEQGLLDPEESDEIRVGLLEAKEASRKVEAKFFFVCCWA